MGERIYTTEQEGIWRGMHNSTHVLPKIGINLQCKYVEYKYMYIHVSVWPQDQYSISLELTESFPPHRPPLAKQCDTLPPSLTAPTAAKLKNVHILLVQ